MRYRTLKIRRSLTDFAEEERRALVSVLKGAEALARLIHNSYAELARGIAELRGLMYFYDKLMYFKDRNNGYAKFDCQVRVNNERDYGRGVFVDLPTGELRLRRVIPGRSIVVKLREHEVRYIRQRLEEGGKLAFAEAWVEDGYLYVALVFRRDARPIEPKKLVVVDVNALHNGVVVALIDGKIREVKEFKAPAERVARLYKQMLRQDESKIRNKKARRIRNIIRDFVNKTAHEIVQLALREQAEVWIDTPFDKSVRELHRSLPPHAKILLAGMRKLAKRVEEQAAWYGVPVRRKVLPSTKCPRCDNKLREVERVMICDSCGFIAERDRVPIHWALKKWREIKTKAAAQAATTAKTSPQTPSFSPVAVVTALS
ncbi:MAG: transposase [Pyrobaculum sp.]